MYKISLWLCTSFKAKNSWWPDVSTQVGKIERTIMVSLWTPHPPRCALRCITHGDIDLKKDLLWYWCQVNWVNRPLHCCQCQTQPLSFFHGLPFRESNWMVLVLEPCADHQQFSLPTMCRDIDSDSQSRKSTRRHLYKNATDGPWCTLGTPSSTMPYQEYLSRSGNEGWGWLATVSAIQSYSCEPLVLWELIDGNRSKGRRRRNTTRNNWA